MKSNACWYFVKKKYGNEMADGLSSGVKHLRTGPKKNAKKLLMTGSVTLSNRKKTLSEI